MTNISKDGGYGMLSLKNFNDTCRSLFLWSVETAVYFNLFSFTHHIIHYFQPGHTLRQITKEERALEVNCIIA